MIKSFFPIAVSILLTAIACTVQNNTFYRYFDGSGNNYKISQTLLEYNPITAKKSSSGRYDGGKYVKKTITKADFEEISELLDSIVARNTKNQSSKRVMMSGLLEVNKQDKTSTFIIPPKSNSQKKIEGTLKSLINNNL